MTLQTRREALLAFTAAGLAIPVAAVVATTVAQAQTTPEEGGGNYADYVTQTLTVGTVAMQTSEVAAEKAQNEMVKEFANLEVAEQQTIASVLSSTEAGKSPPQLPEAEAAKVQELSDMEAGPEFDAKYIQGQIDGHNQLLEIQRTLSSETVASVEAITARLAEQAVTSHLAMLNHIQMQLGSGSGQSGSSTNADAEQSGGSTSSGTEQSGGSSGSTEGEAPAEGATPPAGSETAPATNG
jgi:putative membrane protein